jgi:hypothetical protein
MAATASVDISKEGDATVFAVNPGGVRRPWSMIQIGGTFIGAGLLFRESMGPMLFWMCVGLGALIILALGGDMRPKSHRRKSVIRVSEAGFDVNGTAFPRSTVKRLIVRNPLKSNTPARTVIFTGPSIADVNAQMATQRGFELEWEALVDGTYEIVLDADHKDTVIAGNLSAQSVDRLFRSLCDVSGLVYTKG